MWSLGDQIDTYFSPVLPLLDPTLALGDANVDVTPLRVPLVAAERLAKIILPNEYPRTKVIREMQSPNV